MATPSGASGEEEVAAVLKDVLDSTGVLDSVRAQIRAQVPRPIPCEAGRPPFAACLPGSGAGHLRHSPTIKPCANCVHEPICWVALGQLQPNHLISPPVLPQKLIFCILYIFWMQNFSWCFRIFFMHTFLDWRNATVWHALPTMMSQGFWEGSVHAYTHTHAQTCTHPYTHTPTHTYSHSFNPPPGNCHLCSPRSLSILIKKKGTWQPSCHREKVG